MTRHSFTIPDLLWFNRCLYPEDFRETLVEHGVDTIQARYIKDYLVKHPHAGILGVYQEWIDDKDLHAVLDKILLEFIRTDKM